MDEQATRDYEEAVADGTADAVWIEDEADGNGRVETTADAGSWLDVLTELAWIGTDGDTRDEAEKRPDDRRDAQRLLMALSAALPAGLEHVPADTQITILLTEEDGDRIGELTGITVG